MKFSQQRQLDKVATKASEELTEMLQDTARKMANDQAAWLDKVMMDILPPMLYEAGKCGDLMDEIEFYLKKHGFVLVFIPDSLGLRVMRNGEVHAEFKTELTVDGELLEKHPAPFDTGLN
jgi:hypothetical protein